MIGRRNFITLLGGSAAAWPRGLARVQQRANVPRIVPETLAGAPRGKVSA